MIIFQSFLLSLLEFYFVRPSQFRFAVAPLEAHFSALNISQIVVIFPLIPYVDLFR